MSTWKNITIPGLPITELVLASKIPLQTKPEAVHEFFRFCGAIKTFDVKSADDGQSQDALIWFEKATASRTACMLDNALLDDQPIGVKYYFDVYNEQTPSPEHPEAAKEGGDATAVRQEQKSRLSIVSELMASGYIICEGIQRRAKDLDQKYGITAAVQPWVEQAKAGAVQLDQKLHVTDTVHSLDNKFQIKAAVDGLTASAASLGNQAINTAPGQYVKSAYETTLKTADDVHQESLRIAEQKRQSETVQPETVQPETVQPGTAQPETAQPQEELEGLLQ